MHFYCFLFGCMMCNMYFCIVLLKNTRYKECIKSAYNKLFVQIYKIKTYKTIVMARKKRIRLKYGKIPELAKICGCSVRTVKKALAWNTDSDTENLVRKRAEQLGFIKRF